MLWGKKEGNGFINAAIYMKKKLFASCKARLHLQHVTSGFLDATQTDEVENFMHGQVWIDFTLCLDFQRLYSIQGCYVGKDSCSRSLEPAEGSVNSHFYALQCLYAL